MSKRESWLLRMRSLPCKQNRGSEEEYYDTGVGTAGEVIAFADLKPDDAVLDLGCGNGRVALGFSDTDIFYVGVDVQKSRIKYCRKMFEDQGRMEFHSVDIQNPRYRPAGASPLSFKLEWPECYFDAAIAISLFTHLGQEMICEHYLKEMKRMVRPGGKIVTTWLTSPPMEMTGVDYSRSIFKLKFIKRLHDAIGLKIIETSGEGVIKSHLTIKATKEI